MGAPVVCLVTIHGIGFEQPPLVGVPGYPDTPGYADGLHEHLSRYLDESWLCDDPLRARSQPGENGPIYVQSAWPPGSRCHEAGLRRLGSWNSDHTAIIADPGVAPLSDGRGRIAHIALVYSNLEAQGPQIGAALITSAMAVCSLRRYTTVTGLVRMLLLAAEPLWRSLLRRQSHMQSLVAVPSLTGLRVRHDPGFRPRRARRGRRRTDTGLLTIVRQLEDDVAAYVCFNATRQRVRSFVRDALTRLAARQDVAGIVLNAHSNGTVIAYDVLCELPPFAMRKMRALITAGSPLRKYSTLFNWGCHIETVPGIVQWLNYLDPHDPVADPLMPGAGWTYGKRPTDMTGLFKAIDAETGILHDLPIKDQVVNNLVNSLPGGLQAHNYWDNEAEFVVSLAELLRREVQESVPTVIERQALKQSD
ncbi:MAG: hypothetical protein IMW89_05135 [Ktedonobacteraceae bacterium]|nr:hypothetical protein [Ktedonobacteraceae bacterium]